MIADTAGPTVVAVCLNPRHTFSKVPQSAIQVVAGQGVLGDAHYGSTVQHLYLKRKDPLAPNRMQVHLLQAELFAYLDHQRHTLQPGQLGENITTAGLDLLRLPLATRLHLGSEAVVELAGLRTPCKQIEAFQPGLLQRVLDTRRPAKERSLAGVMAIVLHSGTIRPGDRVEVEVPPLSEHKPLRHL